MEPFSFGSSNTLDHPVSVRIINLEGDETPYLYSTLLEKPELRHVGSNQSPNSDLYATVQLWAGSKPLTVPVQTAYKSFRNERNWNEWLSLPIPYKSLPLNSCLAITLWDLSPTGGKDAHGHAVPFGGTTLPLFDKENQLQKGRQKCVIYRHELADGNDNTTTPSSVPKRRKDIKKGESSPVNKDAEELERIERLLKKHEMNEIPRVEWLDQLVYRGAERRSINAAKNTVKSLQRESVRQLENGKDSEAAEDEQHSPRPGPSKFTLYVELPRFDFPVVFADHEYPPLPISSFQHLSASQSNFLMKPPPEVSLGPGIKETEDGGIGGRVIRIYDPEVGARENPAESKHRRLARSQHRHGILDKDLRPNAKVRDELNLIMSYSPTHVLTSDERDLVWKFRYHLAKDKRALTKFVKSVNWQDPGESKLAVQVLVKWTEIDVDDALELLGPTFDNSTVRAYAVDRLKKADDHELLLYLLQLVQALKFEHISAESDQSAVQASSLASFLISRAINNFALGNYFFWYLNVEYGDKSDDDGGENIRSMYAKVSYDFMLEMEKQPGGKDKRTILKRQAEIITVLSKISAEIRSSNETAVRKVERVKAFLSDPKNELSLIDPPIPLPLDPDVLITGVVTEETRVFKSSLSPIMVTFKTAAGGKYPMLFKTGDDLRQDQLVIQIITLMDQLLQKENLDLKLSPYKILATSPTAGATQFVPSQTFAAIVSKYRANPVLAFLKQHNPDDRAYLGLRKETLDTFVKSCAGYCVITYILGVGDRHLDNLLLAPDGHFFHADFGFILGRDPKPFAPVVKLSKEMADAMGGANPPSEAYLQFKQYCFLAFSALRKSSNLILNLFSLMVHANIPDIRYEPDKAVSKVRERFHLDLSEEDSIKHLDLIMENSLNGIMPVVIDRLHEIVQAWR
ncbi:phosphatidylinositol 3 [Microdochium bolleyi]|uniref:Phosphatidylinositol 3-kinase VPS34 n=1 Tax=Microdochium bolleyi TaxID=196109 RepID=A0A136J9S1_9PEZI|nr:phosphatidylinositol 3 [Microdochium bolleyi]